MQQSTNTHYVEMTNYSDETYQQLGNAMINPVVPQANLTLQMNPTSNGDEQVNQLEIRYQFLLKYYVKQIFQILGIAIVFGLNQIQGLSSVYLSEVNKEWWGSSYNYYQYQEYAGYYSSQQEYQKWKESKRREYMDYEFTWVYYFIVALTASFTLFVAFTRNHRSFTKYQNCFLKIQTVLFGILLGGFASVSQNSWQYNGKICYTLFALQSLIVNAIFNIVLIKKKKIQIYQKLVKAFTFLFFQLNILVGFKYYYIPEALPIVQFFVIYFFFYFDRLNDSLLIQPSELPQTITIFDALKSYNNDEILNGIQSNQVLVINKKLISIILTVSGLILLEVISYFINSSLFIIISIIAGSTLFNFIVPIQVAQQNLDSEDVSIAVMMTYLDIFCPIPNLLRRLRK